MKERPILFNAEMVRAVLDGTKTQTRRVVKPQPVEWKQGSFSWPKRFTTEKPYPWKVAWHGGRIGDSLNRYCPYGVPGDRLWVREAWRVEREVDHMKPSALDPRGGYTVDYRADLERPAWANYAGWWRSSIHMPRWASRINLEVADVRVERVQEISDANVLAEGIQREQIDKWREWLDPRDVHGHAFGELWDSINAKRGPKDNPGAYSWDWNPWVWVVEFKVHS